ncbi:hypothetical protein DUNSADRAFT_16796 [Dunaliella salina]|uniref:Secreted protein n=1 Tax=Dunaliella salina TaxID=3046 RepID=A0ABQ7H0N9_DUNSA|nr:hypothetical protein DUNSADRAFT_16796 [Dunaliella salina]|eukprot:KAF5840419.1 hypothetical protein DUNSADRAFT_16796 [Dunaliella salina]
MRACMHASPPGLLCFFLIRQGSNNRTAPLACLSCWRKACRAASYWKLRMHAFFLSEAENACILLMTSCASP